MKGLNQLALAQIAIKIYLSVINWELFLCQYVEEIDAGMEEILVWED